MSMFVIGVIVGAVGLIVLACIFASSSSSSGSEPYSGTPAYHASRQVARIGPASLQADYLPTTLTTSVEVETPYGRASYKSSGPPDAVLQGNYQFISALSLGWAEATRSAQAEIKYRRSQRQIGR